MAPWKRRSLLERIIFRFHVKLWGCIVGVATWARRELAMLFFHDCLPSTKTAPPKKGAVFPRMRISKYTLPETNPATIGIGISFSRGLSLGASLSFCGAFHLTGAVWRAAK